MLRQNQSPPSLLVLAAGTAEIFLEDPLTPDDVPALAARITRPGAILEASLLCPQLSSTPVSVRAGEKGASVASFTAAQLPGQHPDVISEDAPPVDALRLINALSRAFWRQGHILRQQVALRIKLDRTLRHFRAESEMLLQSIERQMRNRNFAELTNPTDLSSANLHLLLPVPPKIDMEKLLKHPSMHRPVYSEGRRYRFADEQIILWGENIPYGIYAVVEGEVETVFSGLVIEHAVKDSLCGLLHRGPADDREMVNSDLFCRACGDSELQYLSSSWEEFQALLYSSPRLREAVVVITAERYENMLFLTGLVGQRIRSDCALLDGEASSCAAFFHAAEGALRNKNDIVVSRIENIRHIARQLRTDLANISQEP